MIRIVKRELLIYIAIFVVLSLSVHPQRIVDISSPFQLLHAFAWSFAVYMIILALRKIVLYVVELFHHKEASE